MRKRTAPIFRGRSYMRTQDDHNVQGQNFRTELNRGAAPKLRGS